MNNFLPKAPLNQFFLVKMRSGSRYTNIAARRPLNHIKEVKYKWWNSSRNNMNRDIINAFIELFDINFYICVNIYLILRMYFYLRSFFILYFTISSNLIRIFDVKPKYQLLIATEQRQIKTVKEKLIIVDKCNDGA